MHLRVHYPFVILQNGPVVHYSCMKFEREHHNKKEVALGTTSNVNLPLTMSIRDQLKFCYYLKTRTSINCEVTLGQIDEKCNANLALKFFYPEIEERSAFCIKYIEILGKKFSDKTVFVTKFNNDGMEFGIVKSIFSYNNNVYFKTQELRKICFNSYYYAYEVDSNCNNSVLIEVNSIPRLPPCHFISKHKVEFVATRFDV